MKFQIGLTNQTKVYSVGGGYDHQLQRNASEKSKTDHIVKGIDIVISTNIAKGITFLHRDVIQSCLTMKVAIAM